MTCCAAAAGGDVLNGGGGIDTASYAGAASGVLADLDNATANTGEAAGDSYINVENIIGTGHDDTLRGNADANAITGDDGDDGLFGRAGDDWLNGGSGGDTLHGSGGTDTASYAGAASGVIADLDNAAANTGDAAGDSYVSIENLEGTSSDDGLRGTAGANRIDGGAGDDGLFGRGGDDILAGGTGNDNLNGAGGNDTFVFADDFGTDTISAFSDNDDEKIDLGAVTNITSFSDLVSYHLVTDADTGFAQIVDGANTVLINGVAKTEIGVGLAYSENDFVF